MVRIVIPLQKDEGEALILFAAYEHRDPKVQAALIIRKELQRRGLLPPEEPRQPVDPPRPKEQK